MSRRIAIVAVGLPLAVSACGTKQTLAEAVKCDDFKRLADGTWSAIQDISLDYIINGVQHQLNFPRDTSINGSIARQEPQLVPALERKCGPGR